MAVAVGLVALGLVLGESSAFAGAHEVHAASYSGKLTAEGNCPFDYEYDTAGQSWATASYSGSLVGFVPNATYYVYDDNGNTNGSWSPAPVTADAEGQIVLTKDDLSSIPGPDGSTGFYPIHNYNSIPISISTYNGPYNTSPPAGQVYRPATTLVIDPTCNAWRAPGGTSLTDDTSFLTSSNQRYELGENKDQTGDFCIFAQGKAVWCTHTMAATARMVMQRDGNLVVYSSTNRPLWQSGTYDHAGAYLVMQSDRNLVLYSSAGKALWQSGTYIR